LRPVITALDGLFGRLADARDAERSFVANAAHELRTPLAGLATHADIARRSADPEVRQRALGRITESVDRMNRLVQQLLLLARQEAHGADVGASDASVVVARVTADLNAAARARGIELRTAGLDQQASMPIGDERLGIAVRNLVENAVRHGPANSPVLIRWCAKDRELTIEDRGSGIPAVELGRVRRRFERGAGTTVAGSGLGLSIVDAAIRDTPLKLQLRSLIGGGFAASICPKQ
jgi:two-component system sensor histidine kinase QseC